MIPSIVAFFGELGTPRANEHGQSQDQTTFVRLLQNAVQAGQELSRQTAEARALDSVAEPSDEETLVAAGTLGWFPLHATRAAASSDADHAIDARVPSSRVATPEVSTTEHGDPPLLSVAAEHYTGPGSDKPLPVRPMSDDVRTPAQTLVVEHRREPAFAERTGHQTVTPLVTGPLAGYTLAIAGVDGAADDKALERAVGKILGGGSDLVLPVRIVHDPENATLHIVRAEQAPAPFASDVEQESAPRRLPLELGTMDIAVGALPTAKDDVGRVSAAANVPDAMLRTTVESAAGNESLIVDAPQNHRVAPPVDDASGSQSIDQSPRQRVERVLAERPVERVLAEPPLQRVLVEPPVGQGLVESPVDGRAREDSVMPKHATAAAAQDDGKSHPSTDKSADDDITLSSSFATTNPAPGFDVHPAARDRRVNVVAPTHDVPVTENETTSSKSPDVFPRVAIDTKHGTQPTPQLDHRHQPAVTQVPSQPAHPREPVVETVAPAPATAQRLPIPVETDGVDVTWRSLFAQIRHAPELTSEESAPVKPPRSLSAQQPVGENPKRGIQSLTSEMFVTTKGNDQRVIHARDDAHRVPALQETAEFVAPKSARETADHPRLNVTSQPAGEPALPRAVHETVTSAAGNVRAAGVSTQPDGPDVEVARQVLSDPKLDKREAKPRGALDAHATTSSLPAAVEGNGPKAAVPNGPAVKSIDGSPAMSQVERAVDAPSARGHDTASIRIDDADGNSTFVRVTVRGDQVRTNIVHPDRNTAGQLAAHADQLRDALNARGFQDASVSIHAPKQTGEMQSGSHSQNEQSPWDAREQRDGRPSDRESRQDRREDGRDARQERQYPDRRQSRRDRHS